MSWYDEPEPFVDQAEFEEREHARHCDGCPQCDPLWWESYSLPIYEVASAEAQYECWSQQERAS